MKQKIISWSELDDLCLTLSQKIKKIKQAPLKDHEDCIVAIAKGGLVPARILAKYLNINKIFSFGASSYEGTEKGNIQIYQKLPRISCNNIFIVDDISDTGDTFSAIDDHMKKYSSYMFQRYFTASVFVKEDTKRCPDFYVETVPKDTWVVFPFESP